MTHKTFIAVICGLKSEAKTLIKICADPRLRVGVSGASADRAEEIAAGFCKEGAAAIVSFGLSGGLDPSLAVGTVLVGGDIIDAGGVEYEVSPVLAAEAQSAIAAAVFARLYGSDKVILTAEEKANIYRRTGAVAVDMESHSAARAANAAGVPFLAVRAIADPAERALPKAALSAIAGDGSTRTLSVLAAAMRDPKQFPALMQAGADSAAAMKALRGSLGRLFPALFLSLDL